MDRPLPTSSKSLSRGRPFVTQYLALRTSWFRREKLSFWDLPDTLRYLTAFLLVFNCDIVLPSSPTTRVSCRCSARKSGRRISACPGVGCPPAFDSGRRMGRS